MQSHLHNDRNGGDGDNMGPSCMRCAKSGGQGQRIVHFWMGLPVLRTQSDKTSHIVLQCKRDARVQIPPCVTRSDLFHVQTIARPRWLARYPFGAQPRCHCSRHPASLLSIGRGFLLSQLVRRSPRPGWPQSQAPQAALKDSHSHTAPY